MKFVGNFIVFGLIFYLLWTYQPEVFLFLVGMADRLVAFAESFFYQVIRGVDPEDQGAQAIFYLFQAL